MTMNPFIDKSPAQLKAMVQNGVGKDEFVRQIGDAEVTVWSEGTERIP